MQNDLLENNQKLCVLPELLQKTNNSLFEVINSLPNDYLIDYKKLCVFCILCFFHILGSPEDHQRFVINLWW